MTRGLARAVVLILLCDLTVVGVRSFGSQTRVHTRLIPAPPPRTVVVPPPGQAEITGTLTTLAADADVVDALGAPFTVQLPERGAGGAVIANALVGGARAMIVWDGGQPLPITGGPSGALDPSPAHVVVDTTGETVALDGAARTFQPGMYGTAVSVAVGAAGLATPRDGVTFQADAQTTITTHGGALVHLPPHPLKLDGPGNVSAKGTFEIVTANGSRTATTITFGTGSFTMSLTPVSGGYRITATMNGPLQAT